MPIDNTGKHAGDQDQRRDSLELTPEDRRFLLQLEKKLQIVRDRTAGVALGYQSGAIFTGRGGVGKSWAVVGELERLDIDFKLHNSHLSSRALFDCLAENPDSVHVFEDVEGILRERVSLGILRSVLWGSRHDQEGRPQRMATWGAHGASAKLVFGGGIIVISNRKLGDLPEVKALATRVPHHEVSVSDREVVALMKSVAIRGFKRGNDQLDPDECLEIAELIIRESARLGRDLDMRLLFNSFADRLQADDHHSGLPWRDLVLSQICERPVVAGDIESASIRKGKLTRELEVAREIVALPPEERLKIWVEKTHASRATLYRRLRKLAEVDAISFDF